MKVCCPDFGADWTQDLCFPPRSGPRCIRLMSGLFSSGFCILVRIFPDLMGTQLICWFRPKHKHTIALDMSRGLCVFLLVMTRIRLLCSNLPQQTVATGYTWVRVNQPEQRRFKNTGNSWATTSYKSSSSAPGIEYLFNWVESVTAKATVMWFIQLSYYSDVSCVSAVLI